MKTAILHRSLTTQDGTFGIFSIPFHHWCCFSLENPWLDNAPFESCIPAGEYICRWTQSNRFGRQTYQIMNVPGRTGIRFHPFNFVIETDGCPGLGKSTGYTRLKRHLIDSEIAISQFEEIMSGDPFKLSIIWSPGMEV